MKTALFEHAERRRFCDPLTGCVPCSERNLSGLLSFYAQRQSIAWNQVGLYDCTTFERKASAADLVTYPGTFLSEYVLPNRDEREGQIWGGMPADMLYISADLATVVVFENKIGSRIGYEPTSETNQLARQLDYLVHLKRASVKRAAFVLISARSMLESQWYRSDFSRSLLCNRRYDEASGYLMTWEEVFDATTV